MFFPLKTVFYSGKGAYGPPELEKKDLFMLPCQPVNLKLVISNQPPFYYFISCSVILIFKFVMIVMNNSFGPCNYTSGRGSDCRAYGVH